MRGNPVHTSSRYATVQYITANIACLDLMGPSTNQSEELTALVPDKFTLRSVLNVETGTAAGHDSHCPLRGTRKEAKSLNDQDAW